MAIRFKDDENCEMSCAVLVDKGKRGGMQVKDVRISLMLRDFRSHDQRLSGLATTSRLMEMAAKRFKEYFDGIDDVAEGVAHYQAFEQDLITEANLMFADEGLAVRRFVLVGWEASVESLAGIMGIELEGAVKH